MNPMKKYFLPAMFIAAAAIAFNSCSIEEIDNVPVEGEGTVFNITATVPQTKTVFGELNGSAYPTKWTNTNNVEFSCNEAAVVATSPNNITDGTTATFAPSFTSPAASGTIYAFSPQGTFNSNPNLRVGGFTSLSSAKHEIYLIIPSKQTPLSNSVDESAQALYGSESYSDSNTSIGMTFEHITAYGKMKIENFSGTIKSVDIVFPVNVAGPSCQYYYAKYNEIPAGTLTDMSENTITLVPTNVVNNEFWFACAPTAGTTGTMKVIITDNSNKIYTKQFDLSSKNLPFVKGEVSKFSVDFNGIKSSSPDATYTIETLATANSWTNSSAYNISSDDNGLTDINMTYSGTSGKYYSSDKTWRFYTSGGLTVAGADPNTTITKIKITADVKTAFATETGTYSSSTGEWTGSANSIAFTTSATTKVSKIEVWYSTKVLSSIALSGSYKTEYNTGESFSFAGGTVTATYSDETNGDVTSAAVFSGYDLSTPGNQTVTVSFTLGATTKTAQYNINVTAVPVLTAGNITNVAAVGVIDAEHSYSILYHADDISVSEVSGCVTEAIAAGGEIVYTVSPNYTNAAANGTIVLVSDSDNSLTTTITVSQVKSTLSCSAGAEIIIPSNSTTFQFTVTSKEFGWSIVATPGADKDLSVDKAGGLADNDAQTITVSSSTTSSPTEVLTLGTIEVYRGSSSDPQKKTITVKKAQQPLATSEMFSGYASGVNDHTEKVAINGDICGWSGVGVTTAYWSNFSWGGYTSGVTFLKPSSNDAVYLISEVLSGGITHLSIAAASNTTTAELQVRIINVSNGNAETVLGTVSTTTKKAKFSGSWDVVGVTDEYKIKITNHNTAGYINVTDISWE